MSDSILGCLWVAAILAGRRLGRDGGHWSLVYDLTAQLGHPPYPMIRLPQAYPTAT